MHKNKKFKRFSLGGTFRYNNKEHPCYVVDIDGATRRNFVKTTKEWRKEHGVL
jgi:hypothetical protein